MKILFLTLLDFENLDKSNIYTDLLKEFVKNNHIVSIISPIEKKNRTATHLIEIDGLKILKLKIGNVQKTNLLRKGISTLMLESEFEHGIKKYFSDTKFDLILYSTPPITLVNAVRYVKNRDHATTYLLLKDIFPQNAVDLGILKKVGFKGVIYRYFRRKEVMLYSISDYIGCMSQANVEYILKNNPKVLVSTVEICPNSIQITSTNKSIEISEMRKKYDLPIDKTIFICGGNLGKPQGIDFLIDCLKSNEKNSKVYFVIVGSGTEYRKMNSYFKTYKPINAQLFQQMDKEDYEHLLEACDVGLIFLNFRFTVPNFPSRMLSYMQASLPILAATDKSSDVRNVLEKGEFGVWCQSDDIVGFKNCIEMLTNPFFCKELGENSKKYLVENFDSKMSYEKIISHINDFK